MKQPFRRMLRLLTRTGAIKIFFAYVVFLLVGGLIEWIVEPQIASYGDGLWFCFVSSTTIGYGDLAAVTFREGSPS